jgi:putative transposase
MRHTTFRFTLDPTSAQARMLARHAGASRFAYNQCLRLVTDALEKKISDPTLAVPWSGFDLIKQVNGLAWRGEVSAQVFEEAAVDLGRALSAYKLGRVARVKGHRTGFPRRKRKGHCRESFRLRNKVGSSGACSIRVGEGHPRSVTLPRIGTVRVHDDTAGCGGCSARSRKTMLAPGSS